MKHLMYLGRVSEPLGLAVTCRCGAYLESLGRDESSRNAINNWITEHRKQNP